MTTCIFRTTFVSCLIAAAMHVAFPPSVQAEDLLCVPLDAATRTCFRDRAADAVVRMESTAGCGDFTGDGSVSASDALGILNAAVGARQCLPCVCDLDMSNSITATDALIALNFAVGLIAELTCQADGNPVAWDGGGDGVSWSDPLNWDLDVRTPNLCDDVTIAAGPVVTVVQDTQDNQASSIVSDFPIEIFRQSLTVRSTIEMTEVLSFDGGALVNAGVTAPAVEFTTGGGFISGVTLNAPVAFDGSDAIGVLDGLVLNDTVTFAGGGLNFSGDQTLSGVGEIVFTNAGSVVTGANTVLTIAPDMVIRGGVGSVGGDSGSTAIINQGTISSDAVGQIYIEGSAGWVNEGTISASNGGNLVLSRTMTNEGTIEITGGGDLHIVGNWVNDGIITMTDSTVRLGGSFSLAALGNFQRSGGTVQITGAFDNTPGLALDAQTGSWELAGGEIVGGTISTSEGAEFEFTVAGGSLDAVTIDSPVAIANTSASAIVKNGITLNAPLTIFPGRSLQFGPGDSFITGNSVVVFSGPGGGAFLFPSDISNFTIQSGITVRGIGGFIGRGDGSSASVTNEGTIDSDAGGLIELQSVGAIGVNSGTLRASNGMIRANSSWSNSGRVELSTNGSFTASSDLEFTGTSVLATDIGAIDEFGSVSIAGEVTLSGNLTVALVDGYEPNLGDTFTVMTYGSVVGVFSDISGQSIGNGKQFQANYGANELVLEVVAD